MWNYMCIRWLINWSECRCRLIKKNSHFIQQCAQQLHMYGVQLRHDWKKKLTKQPHSVLQGSQFSRCLAKTELTTTELLKAEFYWDVTLLRWANSLRRFEVRFHFLTLNMKAPRPFKTSVTARPTAHCYFTDNIILPRVLLSPRHFQLA